MHLGELPSIPLDQFCKYAVNTILDLLPHVQDDEINQIARTLKWASDDTRNLKIRNDGNLNSLPRHHTVEIESDKNIHGEPLSFKIITTKLPEELFKNLQEAQNYGKDRTRVIDEIIASIATAEGRIPIDYQDNPFQVTTLRDAIDELKHPQWDGYFFTPSYVLIGGWYCVRPDEFVSFVTYILHGGWFGWSESGIPQCASDTLKQLVTTVA